ncbi:MAG: DUF389 domain-containing protein [Actinomycetota bacterium]
MADDRLTNLRRNSLAGLNVPRGELGSRGAGLTRQERSRILDELYFEGDRRAPYLWRFVALMLFSSSIAAMGLINDSAAVVIGAMLIAPMMTPMMAAAAAIVQTWTARLAENAAILVGGAVLGVATGWLMGIVIPQVGSDEILPGEILARTQPNLIDLGIALAAGAAGAYVTIRKEASSALPGVGIAVALVPPLATAGLTLRVGRTDLFNGAILLFWTNVVAIVVAAGVVFAAAGFLAPRDRVRERRIATLTATLIVIAIAVPLTLNTIVRYRDATIPLRVTDQVGIWDDTIDVEEVIARTREDPLELEIVATGQRADGDVAELARLIADDLDEPVVIDLVFVPVQRANATP